MTQSPKRQTLAAEPLKMDTDADRKPHGLDEMIKEAELLQDFIVVEVVLTSWYGSPRSWKLYYHYMYNMNIQPPNIAIKLKAGY